MDALGKGYSSKGPPNYVFFGLGAVFGWIIGGRINEWLDQSAASNEYQWFMFRAECQERNLRSGVAPGLAEQLADSQVAYLFGRAQRNQLWWRVPIMSILRGICVYILWFLFASITSFFGLWASPNAEAFQEFLLYHVEVWWALGALWAWIELRQQAHLPLIPFTDGAPKRPWFPGDPGPVLGGAPASVNRSADSTGRLMAAPANTPPTTLEHELYGSNSDDVAAETPIHYTEAAASLAKVEPDLRLILMRCQSFLDSKGERNTPRARRLAEIQASVEPDFQNVRTALFAQDTPTAVRILTERIHAVTEEIATLFGNEDF